MNVATVIGIIGGVFGILTATCTVITFFATRKKNHRNDGEDDGWLKSDVEYLKRGSDEVRLDIKDLSRKQDATTERVVRLEESAKQAHKRIDNVERRLNHNKGGEEE